MYTLLWRPLLSIYAQLPIHLSSWMDRGDFGSLTVQRWEMLQPNTMDWCIWHRSTSECKNSVSLLPVSAWKEISWRGAAFQICLQGQLYLSFSIFMRWNSSNFRKILITSENQIKISKTGAFSCNKKKKKN